MMSSDSYIFTTITKDVRPHWLEFFQHNKSLIESILKIVEADRLKYNGDVSIFPYPEKVFEAFKYFDLQETKLVLLGQDPYPNSVLIDNKKFANAMGLSFSVPKETGRIPASLKNIYKELVGDSKIDGFELPKHGDISRWAKEENILMLNSALTVIEFNAGAHLKIWQPLTDLLIKYISDNCENVVFLLLGNPSKSKAKLIDKSRHHIVEGLHPSPLSAYRGFFGSGVFSQVNERLKSCGKKEINWSAN